MYKKHLITCSVIVVLFVLSKLFIYSTTLKKAVVKSKPKGENDVAAADTPAILNFANEPVPVHDPKVAGKLNYSIKQHSFKHLHSNSVHHRAAKMFKIIEPILKHYGIPDDFKYIPVVESGLEQGVSPKGAKGLWQFMPGTARTYGLKVNSAKDERLNLKKSTVAACHYLRELYGEFHNWTLVAAAYNNGSIKLARQMKRQKKHNYFRLHLNHETGRYIYDLVAVKQMISKPGETGYNYGQPDYMTLN
ncbi:MAG: lytic transglycosylase domain-containing protein [Sphingobacteriaceae bacterium]|nr:MAG: lytic transglycosylase domain-containing protein [Sphingobacteriaceae bacterium]